MDSPAHAEGSKAPHKRRQKFRKVAEVDAAQAPEPVEAFASDPAQPEASSSRLAESGRAARTPRREKKRKQEEKQARLEAEASAAAPAAPATTADGKVSTSRRRKSKKDKKASGAAPAVDSDDDDDTTQSRGWKCTPLARSSVSRIPHLWSRDGRFYFTASGTSIDVHSATAPSFPVLSTLSSHHPRGHKQPITSLALHPTNPLQIISVSQDGTLKIWDWVEGRLVKSVHVVKESDGGIGHLCVGEIAGKFFAFVTAANKRGDKKANANAHVFRVYRIPLSTPKSNPMELGKVSNSPTAIFVSPSSTYLVVLALNKAYAYRLSDIPTQGKPTSVKFVSDQPLTCGAFAPQNSLGGREEWFATGDKKGVIRLWHGLAGAFRQSDGSKAAVGSSSGDGEKRLPTTSLHWHAHAVAAIAFTTSGSQLLSVGEESVLVQWHLASGRREYIPRLGGRPLISLGVKPAGRGAEEEYWMSATDGSTIRVGASSGKVSTIGHGVRLDPLRPISNRPYPLAVHPATSAVVMPSSHPSTLQFVDPTGPSVLFDLEVSPSNRVSRRDEKQIEPIGVEQVAFSNNAEGQSRWMATYEGKAGTGACGVLKFWHFDMKYQLNTQHPQPHGASPITNVLFGPIPATAHVPRAPKPNPLVLTSAADGTAKLWQVRQAKKSDQGKSAKQQATSENYWSMRSSFEYRGMPVVSSAFSADGTIVALAHGSVISLWDTSSCALLRTLVAGQVTDLRHVIFVGKEGRYIVGAGRTGLAVWDLLSCEVIWSDPKQAVRHLVSISGTTNFVVGTEAAGPTTTFSVYDVSAHTPVRTDRIPHHFRAISIIASRSAPANPARALNLIGVTATGEIFRFGDNVSAQVSQTRAVKTDGQKGTSIWQEMFGKDAFVDELVMPPASEAADVSRPRSGRPIEVFDGPSHTMPPVSLLFDAFIQQIIEPKTAADLSEPKQEGDRIVFEQEPEVVTTSNAAPKPRVISDQELDDLEKLFRGMSSKATGSSAPETPAAAKSSANGRYTSLQKGRTPPSAYLNGNDGATADEAMPSTGKPDPLVTPINTHSKKRGTPNGVGSGNGRPKVDGALRSAIKLTSAQRRTAPDGIDSDSDAVVETPKMGADGERGKKRKARLSQGK